MSRIHRVIYFKVCLSRAKTALGQYSFWKVPEGAVSQKIYIFNS